MITYTQRDFVEDDRNPNGTSKVSCQPFLVGDLAASRWTSDRSPYGEQHNSLRPAWTKIRGQCWLLEWDWHPSQGYSAAGGGSKIVDFAEGVELLLRQGIFKLDQPILETIID